jgi:hypothetical protein
MPRIPGWVEEASKPKEEVSKESVNEEAPLEIVEEEEKVEDLQDIKPKIPTVYDFLEEHGRLPRIDDAKKPWEYLAWLLPYIQGIHSKGLCGDRWGYYSDTLLLDKLLDEPIPKVEYEKCNDKVLSDIESWLKIIGYAGGGWSDFERLIDWLGFALGTNRNPDYVLDASKQEKLYRIVNIGHMLESPYDYFGQWIAVGKAKGWNPSGFYPTPHQVVKCMTDITFHDIKVEDKDKCDPRLLSVCDPCVGTGRMLLHASNYSMNLYGQDIDSLVIKCCLINGALFAPWLGFPLPKSILGDKWIAPSPLTSTPVSAEHPPLSKKVHKTNDTKSKAMTKEEIEIMVYGRKISS